LTFLKKNDLFEIEDIVVWEVMLKQIIKPKTEELRRRKKYEEIFYFSGL